MNILIRTVTKRIGNPPALRGVGSKPEASLERERAGVSGKDVDNAKIGGQHRQYVECGFTKRAGQKTQSSHIFCS